MNFKTVLLLVFFTFLSNLNANNHLKEEQKLVAAPGEISLEKLEVNNDLDMYVGKYNSCGNATGNQHHHPVGVLVYVVKGRTFSNISGEVKEYKAGDYWFEPAGLVHGGDDPTLPQVGEDECTELVVVRLAKKGQEPTIFIE